MKDLFLAEALYDLLGAEQTLENDLPNGGVSDRSWLYLNHQDGFFCLVEPQIVAIFSNVERLPFDVGGTVPSKLVPQPAKFPNSASRPALR